LLRVTATFIIIIIIIHSFVAGNGNLETSVRRRCDSGEYETAASVPVCLVQTVKVDVLMGQLVVA
jgi:hypothetical protein